jgi:hypothetical protein
VGVGQPRRAGNGYCSASLRLCHHHVKHSDQLSRLKRDPQQVNSRHPQEPQYPEQRFDCWRFKQGGSDDSHHKRYNCYHRGVWDANLPTTNLALCRDCGPQAHLAHHRYPRLSTVWTLVHQLSLSLMDVSGYLNTILHCMAVACIAKPCSKARLACHAHSLDWLPNGKAQPRRGLSVESFISRRHTKPNRAAIQGREAASAAAGVSPPRPVVRGTTLEKALWPRYHDVAAIATSVTIPHRNC